MRKKFQKNLKLTQANWLKQSSLWPDQKTMSFMLWSLLTIRVTNIPGDTTSGKYVIKIPRFDSGTPEEWIIFVDLVQKSLKGQNVSTGPPMYKCMERVLKGDAKAEFLQKANLVGSRTVANFTTVMATMTVHLSLIHI